MKLYGSSPRLKVESIYLNFDCAIADKPGRSDDVTFKSHLLPFLVDVHQNKRHFWDSELKLNEMSML